MKQPSVLHSALALALALPGCKGAFFSRDTEEQSFRASCTPTACDRELESPAAPRPPRCPAGLHAGFALAGSRLALACHACVEGERFEPAAERCRPLVCGRDADCPPFVGPRAVRCEHGLCVQQGVPTLSPLDALGLCMAGAGRSGESAPTGLADRRALAARACTGEQCRAPEGCHGL